MSSKRTRAVVIGCGHVGAMHARVAHAHPGTDVVALCAPSERRRDPLAAELGAIAFSDVTEMLSEVQADCALIASPDALHVPHARQALASGLHVFAEKPLGMSLEETTSVRDLAAEQGLFLGVNFNRRFAFGYERAKSLLADGEIGRLRQLWLQVTDGVPPPHVAICRDIMFWTLLGHHFDLIRYLGGEVHSVNACVSSSREDEMWDDLHATFRLTSGGWATLSCGYREDQQRTTERCELLGSQGGIVVHDVATEVSRFGQDPDQRQCCRPNPFTTGNAFYESLNRHVFDFLDRLGRGIAPRVDGDDAVWATRLAELTKQSAEQQQELSI